MAREKELETFLRELPRLLTDPANRGKFVLIHDDQIDSLWPSMTEALNAGYDRFGLETFLVQEVTDKEQPKYFSRNVTPCRS